MSAVVGVEVLPGAGTVCRRGTAVLWLGLDVPSGLSTALVAVMERATISPDPTASVLADTRDLVATADRASLGAFALLSPTPTGVAVILHGSVLAQNERSQGYSGANTTEVVDVEIPAEQIVVVWATADPEASRASHPLLYDLCDGVVPGGGVALRLAMPVPAPVAALRPQPEPMASTPGPAAVPRPQVAAPTPAPGPATPAGVTPGPATPAAISPEPVPSAGDPTPQAASDGSVRLIDLHTPAQARQPLPMASESGHASAPKAAVPEGSVVEGVLCARGHFNHPEAFYCGICGIGMVQQTKVLVPGPRPSLGVLVLDSGTTFGLDDDYLVGRDPAASEEVRSGKARPLAIEDPRVSRRHALVSLHEWSVAVTDLDSSGGTYIWNPGAKDWLKVEPQQQVYLQPGGRISVGRNLLVFESIRVR